jgi:hypothetical protein
MGPHGSDAEQERNKIECLSLHRSFRLSTSSLNDAYGIFEVKLTLFNLPPTLF